jgi:hypothetical protein
VQRIAVACCQLIKSNKVKIGYFFLITISLLMACSKDKYETTVFTVASQRGTCIGLFGQTSSCLQVKEGAATQWSGFSEPIEGFNYQEGFEYTIEVKVYDITNPPADASSKRYVLKRIISKR